MPEFTTAALATDVEKTFDVAVVGAGPAGLVTGLAAASLGLKTIIVGPEAPPGDGRSAALLDGSVQLLKNLGVWETIATAAAPLRAMRLIDATPTLLRAPEVTFRSDEIGLDAFGWSVGNSVLTTALEVAVRSRRDRGRLVRLVTPSVTRVTPNVDHVDIETGCGALIAARLVAAADGRNSLCRTAAGIAVRSWPYSQTAIVCNFTHGRPHANTSTEFHRRAGPLTVVPAPHHGDTETSSVVWVETPDEAARVGALDDTAFLAELATHLGGLLGRLTQPTPRRVFPLSGQSAATLGRCRIALVGEAGHVLPPIGAQGLNLSIRDAATLATLAAEARAAGADPGADGVLDAYTASRRTDVASRIWGVDLLNRSLTSTLLPVHLARSAGIVALQSIGPLRRRVMREGMTPEAATPALMRA